MSKKFTPFKPSYAEKVNRIKAAPVTDISGTGALKPIKCTTTGCLGMLRWNANHNIYECDKCQAACERNLNPIHR